jgi:lysophospholipase L1-like esterase
MLIPRPSIALLAVLAAVLTGVSGCGGGDEEPVPPSDHLIVSLGDSVASGEGNPDRPARVGARAGWAVRRCHRSRRSGHALAAQAFADPEDPGRVVLLGCSGATIRTGLLRPYAGIEPSGDALERAQVRSLADLAADRSIDAVVLSIGANDVGFARIVQFCILNLGPCWEDLYDPRPGKPGPRVVLEEQIPLEIEELERDYRRLDGALEGIVAPEKVIAVEYFDPTGGPGGKSCTMFFGGVTPAESRWASENVLDPLNAQLRESAEEHGWRLVEGVDERFAAHGLCAGSDRWVVTAGESITDHGIPLFGTLLDRRTRRELLASYKGTLHPNPEGHRQIAELIRPALEEVLASADGG